MISLIEIINHLNYMNGRITIDANVMFGTPVITGTRIPVKTVVKYLHNGYTPEEIIDELPRLTLEDIEAVIEFEKIALKYTNRMKSFGKRQP
jgi:uncharacterized protein (DUF433 family)